MSKFARNLCRAVGILVLALPAAVPAATYEIDASHSAIVFKVSHLDIGWVIGRFNAFKGSYEYDPQGGAAAQGASVVIDTTSVDTNHAERDSHLSGGDFLDLASHKTASFTSTGFSGDKDGGTLSGELTLLGTTVPISIEVRLTGEGKDPWGGYRSGFTGTATLSMADFGLKSRFVKTVDVDIYLEGVRQ